MVRYSYLLETRIVLRSAIFGAGMLAVLVLAGATWVVDSGAGADFASIRAAEAVAGPAAGC